MLANIFGTALAPGVSKNKRLYTPTNIEAAVKRMQGRLADPNARPIVMRTHHDAGDDTRQIVGHLTSVKLDENGQAKYEGVLNGSQAARDLIEAAGDDDEANRSLRNVSIFGWWMGEPKHVRHGGELVETGDDLEIDAVDFTAFPGVEGARIDKIVRAKGAKAGESLPGGRHVITESAEAVLSFVDEPVDEGLYMINDGGGLYTPEGLTVLKTAAESAPPRRRVRRLPRPTSTIGVTVTNETAAHPAKLLGETVIGECYDCAYEDRAGFSISANNGPINVNISAWHGIDPAELEVIAKAAMAAACDALKALDPDMDADIDTDGSLENDDAMESAPIITATGGALPAATITPRDMAAFLARKKTTTETTQTPAPTQAGPTVKESAVTDAKPAETAATTTESADKPLTAADLTAAVTEAFGPVVDALKALTPQTPAAATAAATETQTTQPTATTENAPATNDATESTTKVDFATEAKKAVDSALRESIPQILEAFGVPQRKGVRLTESTDTPTPEQLWDQRGQMWNTMLPGGTPAAPTPPAAPTGD